MKCKRCGRDMQRRKVAHGYIYVCPVCGWKVGRAEERTQERVSEENGKG